MYSKKIFFLIFFLIIAINFLSAQIPSGTISGIVIDEISNKPLSFVNVFLLSVHDSAVKTGTVSDAKGKYEIKNIPYGEYILKYSFIGYKEKRSKKIFINQNNSSIQLDKIMLLQTEVNLDEVEVLGNKTALNNSVDRKIYNVQMDVMSKTGSVSELLQNIPSIQVDLDGNVSLRGSADVLILINGKTSPLMGKTKAEVLQQMPANTIEKIEVITNPSAKFKPDGTAGIINLVLKKESGTGLNGNVGSNIGNQSRYNGNFSLNYNPGIYNIFSLYSIKQDERNNIGSDVRTQISMIDGATSYYSDNNTSYTRPISHRINLGLDYNIDKFNSLGLSGNYFYRGFTRNDKSNKIISDLSRIVVQDYDRLNADYEYEDESGAAFYFQHNFPTEDHKIRIDFNYSNSPEKEDNRYTNVYRIPYNPTGYDNNLVINKDIQTQITLEYSNPLSESSTLEAGYSGDFNKSDMDYYSEYYDLLNKIFIKDIYTSNRFIYYQTIHALYCTYSNRIGNLKMLGGLRLEQSIIKSDLVSTGEIIKNDYLDIYPTFHLAYDLSETSELQLNYSKRANRPDGDDLNPFSENRDPRNISKGNPNLKPEFIHSVEFGYQWQSENISLVPSIFYRNKYNGFASVINPINDSTLVTTHTNLSTDQSTGLEVVLSASAKNLFNINLGTSAFYEQIDASNLGFSKNKSTITWSGNLSCNVNLTSSTIFQFNSNFRSARLTPQGEYKPNYVVNCGIRQDLFDDKLSVILTASDVFKTLKREMNVSTSWLIQNTFNNRDARIVYLGFTYHFGKPSKKSKEKDMQYDNGL